MSEAKWRTLLEDVRMRARYGDQDRTDRCLNALAAEVERIEANADRKLSEAIDSGNRWLRKMQAAEATLATAQALIEALDRMLVVYRTGDMRSGAAKADALTKAREKHAEALRVLVRR